MYAAPQLADLRVSVARDLRDPDNETFTPEQVLDFINEGIVELNRIRPIEARETYVGDDPLTSLPFNYVFMVEHCVQANVGDPLAWSTVSPSEEEHGYGRNGWTYFGNELHFSPQIAYNIARAIDAYTAAQVHLAVWGYQDRDLISGLDETEVAPFLDGRDEFAVRKYARLSGFRALSQDRALYQQWQQQANNSDISETQLNGMVNTYAGDWERVRKGLYTPRRPAVG